MKLIVLEGTAYDYPRVNHAKAAVIDFEDTPVAEMAAWMDRTWNREPEYKRDLPFEGLLLHGVFPMNRLQDNLWECSVDFGEEIVSHHQHYRNRDVPFGTRRHDFTTTELFRKLLMERRAKQVLIDPLTHQLLVDDFDSFAKDAQIASATEIKDGLVLTLDGVQIFADTYVPRARQWVNEVPGNQYARPQFIVVEPHFEKPYPPIETV